MGTPNSLEMAVQERTAEVAYNLAETRGFVSGREQQDWQEAQQRVADEIQEDLAAIRAGTCQCATSLENALYHRVKEVAYECAQDRGFTPGHELEDWAAAEDWVAAEIDAIFSGREIAQAAPQQTQPQAVQVMPAGTM